MSQRTILIVDDEQIVLDTLKEQVKRFLENDYQIEVAESGKEALGIIEDLQSKNIDVPIIISDHIMPGMNGDEFLIKAHKKYPKMLKIMLTGRADADAVGNAVNHANLYRYIAKPWQPEDLRLTLKEGLRSYYQEQTIAEQNEALKSLISEAKKEITERKQAQKELKKALSEINQLKIKLQAENIYLQREIKLDHNFEEIIGNSNVLQYVLYKVEQVAPTNATVLIQGETGSGKELIARAIHNASPRKNRLMVKIDCTSIPSNLFESELFGHEKGAFTTALNKQIGRFEIADGTTIFIDEVGELPLELQPKLLRFLQEGEFERIGSSKTLKVDVRIIAATNRDLQKEISEGRFREDLFYRLSVFPLTIPPLRKRKDDIPMLVQYLIDKFSKKLGKKIETISQTTLSKLQNYSWPGNIREMENIIERSIITSADSNLEVDLPKVSNSTQNGFLSLEEMERNHISNILKETNWRISGSDGAAAILNINSSTLRSRIKKLGIKKS
jgi:chemotaxis protein methyltransferase CheR